MSFFSGFTAILVIPIFLAMAAAATRPESSYLELASRAEMVNMAGYGEEKLSTVIVTGTLLCQRHARTHEPLPGASIGIKCHTKNMMRGKSSWTHGVTDEFGDFIVDLPSHLHATPNLHKVCSVKVLKLPKNSPCGPPYVGKHSHIKLSSAANGVRTYSAGTIKFLHLESKHSNDIIKRSSGTK